MVQLPDGFVGSSPRLPPHSDGATCSYKALSHDLESSQQLATCFREPTDCSREPTEFCYAQRGSVLHSLGLFLLRLIFLGSRGLLQCQCGEYTEQEVGQRKTIEKASTSVLKNHFLNCFFLSKSFVTFSSAKRNKKKTKKKEMEKKKIGRAGGRERE